MFNYVIVIQKNKAFDLRIVTSPSILYDRPYYVDRPSLQTPTLPRHQSFSNMAQN